MKLGIYGGTFNPPHIGHLIVAEQVREELALDRVVFVPAANPPHKLNDEIISPHHRVAMLRLAVDGNKWFEVSETELQRGGVSFTVDTLTEFNRVHAEDELFLLIGMDNLVEFHTWRLPEKILELASVVVMTRPGFQESEVPIAMRDKVRICPVPEIGIGSRQIRARVREGKSIHYWVADPVREYINLHQLYSKRG